MISMKPRMDEIIISRVKVPQTDISLSERQANPVDDSLPAALPQTASSWYSLLVTGMLALLVAGALRARRKTK